MSWLLSSSSDKRALAVVDGLGKFRRYGPHYSRRTPGSKTFTGCGEVQGSGTLLRPRRVGTWTGEARKAFSVRSTLDVIAPSVAEMICSLIE